MLSGGFNAGDTDHDGKIDVGETWQYSASHTVTNAEFLAGGNISNTASVTTDQGATSSDSASVAVAQTPGMTLVKTALGYHDLNHDNAADAGDVIDYSFLVNNTGNTTLHGIGVTDVNPAVLMSGSPISSLAPGASDGTTYSGTYVITATDVSAGFVDNEGIANSDVNNAVSALHSKLADLGLLA